MSVITSSAPVLDLDTVALRVDRVVVSGYWVACDIAYEFDAATGTLRVTFSKPGRKKARGSK